MTCFDALALFALIVAFSPILWAIALVSRELYRLSVYMRPFRGVHGTVDYRPPRVRPLNRTSGEEQG